MPTIRDVSQAPILTNLAVHYTNEDYIAEQICPTLPVVKMQGKYYIYDKKKFRNVFTKRAIGAPAAQVEPYGLTSTTFYCEDHALKGFVPNEIQDQADAPINAQADETEGIIDMLAVSKERALAVWMQAVANFTNDTTLTTTDQWSDYENSDPIKDVKTAKAAVHAAILKEPNTLVLGKAVYDKLVDHPDIVDRIKYSREGVVTPDVLARVFGVSKVLIGGAGYNTSIEGQADSISYIWGKYAWLLYIAPTKKAKQVTFGWHITYKKRVVEKWTDGDRKGTFIRVHETYDPKIVTELAGYLIKNAIA